MARITETFQKQLDCLNLETLESAGDSIYGLSRQFELVYLNPAWFRFAADNGGEPAISRDFPLGRFVADAISGPLRDYYLEAFARVLATGEVWEHDYECSSPESFRLYHQSVYPLHNRQGLVVVNSLARQEPHPGPMCDHDAGHYTQATGLISQCSNCRRTQRVGDDTWEWVPALVRRMPANTSHTLCRVCFDYYYVKGPRR